MPKGPALKRAYAVPPRLVQLRDGRLAIYSPSTTPSITRTARVPRLGRAKHLITIQPLGKDVSAMRSATPPDAVDENCRELARDLAGSTTPHTIFAVPITCVAWRHRSLLLGGQMALCPVPLTAIVALT